MNYYQAHKLLDETRAGHDHTEADITAALELTGDIDPDVCGNGLGWGRPSVERRETGLPTATVLRTGSGFSGVEINDHRAN